MESPSASKTIHFVRHGLATSNVAVHAAMAALGIPSSKITQTLNGMLGEEQQRKAIEAMSVPGHFDSALTSIGREQARAMRRDADVLAPGEQARPTGVELIVSSSNRRAIQTADLAFGDLVPATAHGKILLFDDLREGISPGGVSGRPPVSEMRRQYAELEAELDYSLLPERDELSECGNEMTGQAMYPRALRAWRFLLARPEGSIVCVCHGGLMTQGLFKHPNVDWVGGGGPPIEVPNCSVMSFQCRAGGADGGRVVIQRLEAAAAPVASARL